MDYLLAIDFGSTFTKTSAICLSESRVIATARAFTTIESDVRDGLSNALKELRAGIGGVAEPVYTEILASSSAGGGLKMVACGLVPELTAKAARIAASSAGAKVVRTFSYELSSCECGQIREIKPDIILLSGGTDGGNKRVAIENARMLSGIDGDFSVIYAGNKSAAGDVSEIFAHVGKHCVICDNVMPAFNTIDIASAKDAIRALFIERIIAAKGLDRAQEMMTGEITPTPLAVFDAMELLARGGLGELLAVDVGGATTDVYSMCDGRPTGANIIMKGLPEPFAKRSVEGDLGLRYGMPSLIEAAGADNIAKHANVSPDAVLAWELACAQSPERIAADGASRSIDDTLAGFAVSIAAERHAGTLESIYTPFGESFIQTGKDLSGVKYVIGIGGPVIGSQNPRDVLLNATAGNNNGYGFLKPQNATLMIDRKYITAACGLIAKKYPQTALKIMNDELWRV